MTRAIPRLPFARLAMFCMVLGAFGVAASPALASDPNTITSPSGFNHCHWYTAIPYAATPSEGVVCTSTAGTQSGHAVVLDTSGRRWSGGAAHRWIFSAGPRLAYGRSLSRWGITCSSSTSGLQCRDNGTRHGVYVSTTKQGFFSGTGPLIIGSPAQQTVVSWDGAYAVRPSRFVYTGDGSGYLTATTWSAWGASGAVGTGYDHINNCTPNCAQGTFHAYPASFTFTRPVLCHGKLIYSVIRIDAIGEPGGNHAPETYDSFLPSGC